MHPWQEEQRQKLSPAAFGKLGRSWFEAWLNKYLGNRHVAKAVIRYGFTNMQSITTVMLAIGKEKTEEANKRKREEEAHGAGEPVWRLRRDANLARKVLREGQRLQRKVDSGRIRWDRLSNRERQLVEDYTAKRLHVKVDQANRQYGHGIARTHDFGFHPGEHMCRDVPIEVRAHLRTLQGS